MSQRGQVVPLALGCALVCLAVAGLAVDLGAALIARRTLQNAADASALAGADGLASSALYASGGRAVDVDPVAAEAAARQVLDARAVPGSARVDVSRERVTVTLRNVVRTRFLALVGIPALTVAAAASAEPRGSGP